MVDNTSNDGWVCDECGEQIVSDAHQSVSHGEHCSLHPANEITAPVMRTAPVEAPVRTPSAIVDDLAVAVDAADHGRVGELLDDLVADLVDSVTLALQHAGVAPETITAVTVTVRDYYEAHYAG
jgi:hypothetical protein